MSWITINSDNDLPEEGKYVLGRYSGKNWLDDTDQDNVNCVVVKLVKGISEKERMDMQLGIKPSYKDALVNNFRHNIYKASDEGGNNKRPYCWRSFGATQFFGQDIIAYQLIEKYEDN